MRLISNTLKLICIGFIKKSGWIKFQNNKCPEKLRRYSPTKEKKEIKFLSKEKKEEKETQGTKEKKRKKEM